MEVGFEKNPAKFCHLRVRIPVHFMTVPAAYVRSGFSGKAPSAKLQQNFR